MIVYRLAQTLNANDRSGEGARLNGGRWNHVYIPCIYCAESRALSVLEYTVNVNIAVIPRALSITTFEIPDTEILEFAESSLPGNWKESPAPSSTKDFGTTLLKAAEYPVIKIPSCVIPDEFNFLLNPLHPGNKKFNILEVKDFIYDVRIKLK
ncbi:MAG: RES family NAD+ phosphorylase [Ferruginibacter sp.]